MLRKWLECTPSPGSNIRYWIWGIYKITSYRPGEYYAYFIRDSQKNWGDHPEPAPDLSKEIRGQGCWKTLASAKASCVRHAKTHAPAPQTRIRARELAATYVPR